MMEFNNNIYGFDAAYAYLPAYHHQLVIRLEKQRLDYNKSSMNQAEKA